MISIFLLGMIPMYLGIEIDYLRVGDFNQHFAYLDQKADKLGWQGDFGRFRNIQPAPLLQCEFLSIRDFSQSIITGIVFDCNKGDFLYPTSIDTLMLKQNWCYWSIPVQFNFSLAVRDFSFFSGIECAFTNLRIKVNKNYGAPVEYTQNFHSEDLGLLIGLRKKIRRFNLDLCVRKLLLDQFRNKDGFLFYFNPDGYIYQGPQVRDSRAAILDFSGIGLRIVYRIF